MRAWQVHELGEPQDVLRLEQVPDPEAGTGLLRLRVDAVALNFPDVLLCRGQYQEKPPLPFTPGYDLVGVVEETGPGVPAQLTGHLVADLCVVGGYAQYAIRPARFLVPVPDGVDISNRAAACSRRLDQRVPCNRSGGRGDDRLVRLDPFRRRGIVVSRLTCSPRFLRELIDELEQVSHDWAPGARSRGRSHADGTATTTPGGRSWSSRCPGGGAPELGYRPPTA